MRLVPLTLALTMTYPAMLFAREAAPSTVVQKEDIRVLGRLNVNTATRDELMQLPVLDTPTVDQLIEARTRGRLTSLVVFQLSADAAARLSVDGPSTLRRIRPLPLETYAVTPHSATR